MRVKTRKQIVAKGKAVLAMRRAVGWTRAEWINEVESALGEAFIAFCKARLADKNGQRRLGRSLTVEFERELMFETACTNPGAQRYPPRADSVPFTSTRPRGPTQGASRTRPSRARRPPPLQDRREEPSAERGSDRLIQKG
jgi:hypothetical protein